MMDDLAIKFWIKGIISKYRGQLAVILVATSVLAVCHVIFPMVWQRLIDQASLGGVSIGLAWIFVLLLVLEAAPILYQMTEKFINRFSFDFRQELFGHTLRLSIPFHKDQQSTKLVIDSKDGMYAGISILRLLLRQNLISDVPVAIFSLGYVARKNLLAAAILVVFLTIFFLISKKLGRKISQIEDEIRQTDQEISSRQRELIQHIEAVKLYKSEKIENDWHKRQGELSLELKNKRTRLYELFLFMSNLAYTLPFGIALIWFLPSVAGGTLSIGTLIALQMYSMRAVAPAGYLGKTYQEYKSNAVKMIPALDFMRQKPTITESKNSVQLNPLKHQISIKNLSFAYPGDDRYVLKNIILEIYAGEKVAIVGPTGSGKTTIARLLVRFYDPCKGIITYDMEDLRQISIESLYDQVCYVSQEVPVFSGTLADNISYGLTQCDQDRIIEACKKASAGFVLNYQDGIETGIGEMGQKLSGGERQRIALARIFLRKPSVVILDEATSALDKLTEKEVQVAFDKLIRMNDNTTMIVIAHRISTVKNADRIVVLDEGKIIDIGCHGELLSRCGLYEGLCRDMT